MKAYEIEVYPCEGDVVIAQENGTSQTDDAGPQFIRVSTDQIDMVCRWLQQAARVARQQQERGD